MALPQELPTLTPEEYLIIERAIDERHEYLDGVVYIMAGESPAHSTICFNLAVAVGLQLRGTSCRGFSPNMKVRADAGSLFAYPDLTVVCGQPRFHDQRQDVLINPTVIFEVLSPSTAAYDRGEKFRRYRAQSKTLQDYILIAQDRPHIEHRFRRPDGAWDQAEISGLAATLRLDAIACQLPRAEIYDRIEFTE